MFSTIKIFYGSQTGNSESIAKEIAGILIDNRKNNVTCQDLNQADDLELWKEWKKEKGLLVIIVCSTTGNGDCPDNALKFWRKIKKRSHPLDTLSELKYIVLGLGDTNYDQFCFMGKQIDKRIAQLGGNRIMPLKCVDEVDGMDEVVEKWIEELKKRVLF